MLYLRIPFRDVTADQKLDHPQLAWRIAVNRHLPTDTDNLDIEFRRTTLT